MNDVTRFLGLLALVASAAVPAAAQSTSWSLFGGFQVGLRSVEVDGREEKYREHWNYEDGPRLFNLNLELVPPDELRERFDRIEIDLTNLGGDPFETARFSIQRYARFSFDFEHRKSAYFYDDLMVPRTESDPLLSNAGDLHRFDLERVHDAARFKLWLTPAARLDFTFDRFTRKGRSTTTLDVERDEFELEAPVDESSSAASLGFQFRWEKITLVLEERWHDFENAVEIFLPGVPSASAGENPDDETLLNAYFLGRPYDSTSYTHTLQLLSRPTRRLSLNLAATAQETGMDFVAQERAEGVDFEGEEFADERDGQGAVNSDVLVLDVDLHYRLGDRLELLAGVRRQDLDQDGELVFGGFPGARRWEIETTTSEAGLELQATRELSVTAGVRSQRRDVRSAPEDDLRLVDPTSGQDGLFLILSWRQSRLFRAVARFETSSFDNPVTLASPGDRESLRLRVRYGRENGLSAGGAYRLTRVSNDASGWESEAEHLNLHAAYRTPLLNLHLGYTAVDVARGIDQRVTAGEQELFFPIAYEGTSDHLDIGILWAAAARLKVGSQVRWYDNEGTFAAERYDVHGYLEFGLGDRYVAHLGYRRIEYDEQLRDFDDYEAGITEISIGRRW